MAARAIEALEQGGKDTAAVIVGYCYAHMRWFCSSEIHERESAAGCSGSIDPVPM